MNKKIIIVFALLISLHIWPGEIKTEDLENEKIKIVYLMKKHGTLMAKETKNGKIMFFNNKGKECELK